MVRKISKGGLDREFVDEFEALPAPAKGDNLPDFDPATIVDLETLADQLRKTYAHLFAERDKYITKTAAWVEFHPLGIKDDDDMKDATDRLAQILTVIDAYHGKPTSAHTVAKEPFLKGGRIVDLVLNKELADTLRETAAKLSRPMKEYADAKVKRQREEAAINAKRAADDLARATAALAQGTVDLDAALAAEQASLDAIAVAENSKSATLSMTRGDLGTSSGLRGKWKARVVNEDLVPRSLMTPNQAAIDLKMNQSKDKKTGVPLVVIPGVEIYEETSLSVRR